jgi:hypothetical protein
MKFHASCKEPISTRDVFGYLTLLGFGDSRVAIMSSKSNRRCTRLQLLFSERCFYRRRSSYRDTEGEAVTVMGDLMAESLSSIKCTNIKDSIEIDVGDPPTPHPTTSPSVAYARLGRAGEQWWIKSGNLECF